MMLARIFLLTCIHANIHTAAYCMHNMHSCILFCTTTLVKTHVEFFCACAQMYQPAGLQNQFMHIYQSIHTRVQYEYYSRMHTVFQSTILQYAYCMQNMDTTSTSNSQHQYARTTSYQEQYELVCILQSSIQTARTRSYQICIVLASSMHTPVVCILLQLVAVLIFSSGRQHIHILYIECRP